MKQNFRTTQAGYAMLLTVLALMGIGGVVLAGFTQSAKQELEAQRYQHNQRVLKQAKHALLMFAYNYPKTNVGEGPGKLLCPDFDNDGDVDGTADCNIKPGRFPWSDPRLNTGRLVDASGETLWYAVSDAFYNLGGGGVVNSDTTGTITLVDQSGGIIYNGNGAGIAAVIIAPGTILKRDEDANGTYEFTQLRDTTGIGGQQRDPRNYLDIFNGFDNAVFTNSESDSNDDGFIMGPIYDTTEDTIVVNDQLVIITADEVIAMAEMATLEAYRTAILDYLGNTTDVYPWLYNYEGIEYDTGVGETNADAVAKLSTFYPADSDFVAIPNYHDDNGRIPSIFAEYFTRTVSRPVESDLKVTLTIDYDAITPVPATISHGNLPLTGDGINPAEHILEFTIPADELTDLRFTQEADDPKGRLTATLAAARTFNQPLYFWDEDESARTNVWQLCPAGGDELSDCHRDGGQNSTPGGANLSREEILILNIEVSLPAGTITFDADYSTAPTLAYTEADANGHAVVSATMQGVDLDLDPLTSPSITVSWQYDSHFHEDDPLELFAIEEQGNLVLADLLGNTTMALEMRYYPELPVWAYDNGWHSSIRMAYAEDHRPGVAGDCNVVPDDDCLKINDPEQGGPRDYVSLLLIGHGHDLDWVDDNEVLPGSNSVEDGSLDDELRDVFDEGNHNGNTTYYTRRGNDRILVIEKL